jgi:hypothetical protein
MATVAMGNGDAMTVAMGNGDAMGGRMAKQLQCAMGRQWCDGRYNRGQTVAIGRGNKDGINAWFLVGW